MVERKGKEGEGKRRGRERVNKKLKRIMRRKQDCVKMKENDEGEKKR